MGDINEFFEDVETPYLRELYCCDHYELRIAPRVRLAIVQKPVPAT